LILILMIFIVLLKGGAYPVAKNIDLPSPSYKSKISLEEAILKRRSVRSFMDRELTLAQVSQILWAAQGITDRSSGHRSAPSAGATYPIDLFVVMKSGIYRYLPANHQLEIVSENDKRKDLANAALGQSSIKEAPLNIVICAEYGRTSKRYGDRAPRYVHIEAGHIAQNIHLQAAAIGLGSVPVGAFRDQSVSSVLSLPDQLEPIYIIPVGYPK